MSAIKRRAEIEPFDIHKENIEIVKPSILFEEKKGEYIDNYLKFLFL
jgi:hypothetical protein